MNRKNDLFSVGSSYGQAQHAQTAWDLGPPAALEADPLEFSWLQADRPITGSHARHGQYGGQAAHPTDGFRCNVCGGFVATVERLSGVRNRNHCPYCLWSKHLDLHVAGDRMAACKERMQPIGLALKRRNKKYGSQLERTSGELMLAHHCRGCGKISINRIAADDDSETLMQVLEASSFLAGDVIARLSAENIRLLDGDDAGIVRRRLFGAQ